MKRTLLEIFRPMLHLFRTKSYKILGIHHLMQSSGKSLRNGQSAETQESYQKILDQVAFLESQVNWRLYGLPSSYGNLRADIAATVSSSHEFVKSLKQLCQWYGDPSEVEQIHQLLSRLSPGDKALIVLSHNSSVSVDGLRSKFAELQLTFISDVDDLLTTTWKSTVDDSGIINTSLTSALSAFETSSIHMLWLSDALARSDALKTLLLLNTFKRLAAPRSVCSGYEKTKLRDLLHPAKDSSTINGLIHRWSESAGLNYRSDQDRMVFQLS